MKQFLIVLVTLFSGLSFLSACSPSDQKTQTQTPPPNIQLTTQGWQDGYPQHWWEEVPREGTKSWEILPQDAGPNEVILSKRNELGLLSNFTETPFVFHGVCYPTLEAFWQMMKFPESENDPRWSWTDKWRYTREQVSQMDGYKAKSAGSYANKLMEKDGNNWVTFEGKKVRYYAKTRGEHFDLIWDAFVEKIRQNPEVLDVLLKTKDLTLRPDHKVNEQSPDEWHFYRLWMTIRTQLQKNQFDLKTQEDLSLRNCKAN